MNLYRRTKVYASNQKEPYLSEFKAETDEK